MILQVPNRIKDVVTFPDNAKAPIISRNATDEQKIIYADFISQYLVDDYSDKEPFFKSIKH